MDLSGKPNQTLATIGCCADERGEPLLLPRVSAFGLGTTGNRDGERLAVICDRTAELTFLGAHLDGVCLELFGCATTTLLFRLGLKVSGPLGSQSSGAANSLAQTRQPEPSFLCAC
jgi:hypothetical protein